MKRIEIIFVLAVFIFVSNAIAGPPRGLSNVELLGRHLYKDKNLSFNGSQSCQVCHHPFSGFADRRNSLNPEVSVVSIGADGVSKGGRNAPTSAYAGFSPILTNVQGNWVGGLFWDGRADGTVLGDPLAEQAQGPPLNPVEMAMPDKEAIIAVIMNSGYVNLFIAVYGQNAFDDIDLAYDNFGKAVAAYERSIEVTKFNSKYDLQRHLFTDEENRGLILFKENCAICHSVEPQFGSPKALFTNYQYYNIGLPVNPLVILDGPDLGLGAVVNDSLNDGKFKVPTLRNIAVSPPYSHNGNFSNLRDMVSFINDNSGFIPEVDRNIDPSIGNMGLTDLDIDDIVFFLITLTDN